MKRLSILIVLLFAVLVLIALFSNAQPVDALAPDIDTPTPNVYQTLMATFHEMFISSTPTPSITPFPPTRTITLTPTLFTPYPIYTIPVYPGPTFNPYPGPTFEVISEPALFLRLFMPLMSAQ